VAPEFAQRELQRLEEWCHNVSDVFWKWYREAPECLRTCAEATKQRVERETSPVFRRMIDRPCTSIYECHSPEFGLRRVRELHDSFIDRHFLPK
jgi:hypothetical protein